MTAPDPIRIVHFTHLRNLQGIVELGLVSDAGCRRDGLTQVEIGSSGVRERRLTRPVGQVGNGGYVGDYVPFYFWPRSPMMFTLGKNNYEYQQGFDDVVYLVTSVPRVRALSLGWVASDRNAALATAEFIDDAALLGTHISWDVIRAKYWTDYADGADLRMAEFLVHQSVPWVAVEAIVAKTAATKARVDALLQGVDHASPVSVRRDWYF